MLQATRIFVVALLMLPALGRAQTLYFVGALAYRSDAAGNNVGGAWEYDTTAATANSVFHINGMIDFALPLSLGTNSFSVTGASANASPLFGLGLFFSTTGAPLSGPFDALPQLVLADSGSAGTAFNFATNGSMVSTFGAFSSVAAYGGATSFMTANHMVTVTAFDWVSGLDSGTLSLSVVAIPEPSVITTLGCGILVLGLRRFRHKLRRRPSDDIDKGIGRTGSGS